MTRGTTDERLDRLEGRVEEGFLVADKRFAEVNERFAEVDKQLTSLDHRFDLVDGRLEQVNERLDEVVNGLALVQKAILFGSVSAFSVVFAGFVALLTQS